MKKTTRSLLVCASAILMTFTVTAGIQTLDTDMPTSTVYAEEVSSGKCGPNAYWSLDDEGTLTISGKGVMYDYSTYYYSYSPSPFKNNTSVTSVVIESGITRIGSSSFSYLKNLRSVYISDTVSVIGSYAFENCSMLENLNIPDSVTYIEGHAFQKCSSLKYTNFSDELCEIGEYAFNECSALTEIVISRSIGNIGKFAFADCSSLIDVRSNGVLTELNEGIFAGCDSLTEIVLPQGLKLIRPKAFMDCDSLLYIELPDSVTTIGQNAFASCDSLKSADIGNCPLVYEKAFDSCYSLRAVTLNGVFSKGSTSYFVPQYYGEKAFTNCSALRHIHIPYGFTYEDYAQIAEDNSLPTSSEYYHSLDEFGNCDDPDCPMGLYGRTEKRYIVPDSISIDETSLRMMTGTETELVAEITPDELTYEKYKNVKWSSDNEDVATVDNGKITAISPGTAVITAATVNGLTAECTVNVTDIPSRPTVTVNTAFGGRTVQLNCADEDADIYYQFGSSNITKSCEHVKAGGTIFINEPKTGTSAAMYFKAYRNGNWSPLGKWGMLNVRIAEPLITPSGSKGSNNFKVYTQTKDSYIVFTLDGTTPDIEEGTQKLKVKNGRLVWSTSTVVTIPKGRTIKTIAIRNGLVTSEIMTFTNK